MRWSIGSTWYRWDPHIHAPGTLNENQYGPHDDDAVFTFGGEEFRCTEDDLRSST